MILLVTVSAIGSGVFDPVLGHVKKKVKIGFAQINFWHKLYHTKPEEPLLKSKIVAYFTPISVTW